MNISSWSALGDKTPLSQPNLTALTSEQINEMRLAGQQIKEAYRLLDKAGLNIVSEVLKGQGTFYEMEHYPKDDVYDPETHSQYYYHNHRGLSDEHGHFHTFLRAKAIPDNIKPATGFKNTKPWPEDDEALAHFVGISMDADGFPIGLFITNRWVTNQTWYNAEDTAALLEHFEIDHAHPNLVVNQWLTAMLKLFKPHITSLLLHRDNVIKQWAIDKPNEDILEDRELEITGSFDITPEQCLEQLEALN